MAQRKDTVYLQEKIDQEERRLQVLKDRRTDPNLQTSYKARGTTLDILVPSFEKPNTKYYIVKVVEKSLKQVTETSDAAGIAKIGCLPLETDMTSKAIIRNKNATTKYPRIRIIHGIGTPTRETTGWGTTWLKNYGDAGDGQSHRILPFGFDTTNTGTVSIDDVIDFFRAQFKQDATAGSLAEVMGTNGVAQLIVGKNTVIESIKRG